MKANKITIFILTVLFALILTGCQKKTLSGKISETNAEITEEAQTEEKPKVEEKKFLDSVLAQNLDDRSSSLVGRTLAGPEKTFTGFSTPLAIGDEILLRSDLPVWKNAVCMSNDVPYIKEDSVVYLLATADSEGKEMIEFCDEKGNAGWVSANFVQKIYSDEDSIIKKLWVQDEYDFACFAPDGKTVAFHRFDYLHGSEKGVAVLNRETGEEICSADAVPQTRLSYAFSPDGKYFYFVTDDDTLQQLDTESGEFSEVTSVFLTSITGIYPLPDGKNVLLALESGGWAMKNKVSEDFMSVRSDDFMWANSFAFSPDGKFIAGSAINPVDICVWDMQGNLVWQKNRELLGELYFSSDSKTLYVVNGTGITALDTQTGEEISKTRISFPYHLKIEDCEVNTEKDRLVFALNERERYFFEEQEKVGSYIYVYEFSTGKFVQAERIEDEGKRIEAIALSPDGEYISIRIRDGAHFNECHQVICKIDLEKEARSLPKIAKNEGEEKALNFLLDTSFDLDGYWSLNFFYDGTYTMSARHDGVKNGRYELYEERGRFFVKFSGCGYGYDEDEVKFTHKDAYDRTWITDFPGTYKFDPDYIDFDMCGAFTYTDDCEIAIPSTKQSPSGKEFDYFFATIGTFEKVYKFPMNGEEGQWRLYVRENTKMRKEPFLSAETVWMSYYDLERGCEESRCVLFANESPHIVGKTVREDTIDGVKAPWYLVEEFDGSVDAVAERVWVFGGFSEVCSDEDLSK